MKANIRIECANSKITVALAESVLPDNIHEAPEKCRVRTKIRKSAVQFHIEGAVRLSTLFSTIDDLMTCLTAAQEAILFAGKLDELQ